MSDSGIYQVLLAAVMTGCSCPAEAELADELRTFAEEHSYCVEDEDCTVVSVDCPTACMMAVRADAQAELENLAEELANSMCYRCRLPCPPAPDLAFCGEGTCAVGKAE